MVARAVLLTVILLAAVSGNDVSARDPWGPSDADIVISEVHYHPPGDRGTLEFVEIHNSGVHWVDLSGWEFTSGIRFRFPDDTFLAPGAFLAVARNAEKLREAYGEIAVVGDFKGRLGNSDEVLELRSRSGATSAWLHYYDGRDAWFDVWPREPDGDGPSLELIQPHPDWQAAWFWAPSRVPGGTPGEENSVWYRVGHSDSDTPPIAPGIEIAEARLTGTSPFVEIYNAGSKTADLGRLRLTRDVRGREGIPLRGTLARRQRTVIEGDAVATLVDAPGRVLLLVADASRELVDSLPLKRPPEGGSAGRDPLGELTVFEDATPGKANPAANVPAVVITEVHYHPRDDVAGEEFVEIHNAGKSAVDLTGWTLARAVDFEFPEKLVLRAGAYAVVAKDVDKLGAKVGAAGRSRVVGPFKGRLSNSADRLILRDAFGRLVDEVPYSDRTPWPGGADGTGFSIELLHPGIDNRWGRAWTLGPIGGTPAAKNARAKSSVPPTIAHVEHRPAIPRPGEPLRIHAWVIGTSRARVSVLYHSASGTRKVTRKSMADRGRTGDGASGDGHFAVTLPRFQAGARLGYSVVTSGRSPSRFPSNAKEELYVGVAPPADPAAPGAVTYALWMAPASWDTLVAARKRSKPEVSCTLAAEVSGRGVRAYRGKVAHRARVRFRGNNSFVGGDVTLFSYRVRLPDAIRFDGRKRINLHGYKTHRQKAGSEVLRRAGLPAPKATWCRLWDPEQFHGAGYLDVEVVDSCFLEARYGSSAGEIFRGKRGREMGNSFGADFSYHGTDPAPYLKVYVRANKSERLEADELIALIAALNIKDDDEYAEKIPELLDAGEWARYFAANSAIGNNEGGLTTDDADDYYLAQRPTDGKFILIPWDHDTTFVAPKQKLFRPRVAAIRRFLRHPAIAPLYRSALRETLDGPLSAASFARRQLASREFATLEESNELDAFVVGRREFLDPRTRFRVGVGVIDATGSLGGGFGWRTFATRSFDEVQLGGIVDPGLVREVRVGDLSAAVDPLSGSWRLTMLSSGLAMGSNAYWVSLIDAAGGLRELRSLNLEVVPRIHRVGGRLAGTVSWSPDAGVVRLEDTVVVSGGATLTVAAGTQIIGAPGALLDVRGRLRVEGTEENPVGFYAASSEPWNGIDLGDGVAVEAGARHTLEHCWISGAERSSEGRELGAAVFVAGANVRLRGVRIAETRGTALAVRGGHIALEDVVIADGESGVRVVDGTIAARGLALRRLWGDGLVLVDSGSGEAPLRDLRVSSIGRRGIAVAAGSVAIESGHVRDAMVGIELSRGTRVKASELVLTGAARAIVFLGEPTTRPPRLALRRSVIWPHTEAVVGRGTLEFIDCVAPPYGDPSAAIDADGITSELPAFAAPQWGDFRRRPPSSVETRS